MKSPLIEMITLEQLRSGIDTQSPEESFALGKAIASQLPLNCLLLLEGNLGTGKTTFIKGLAAGMGIQETVSSPSFNLLLSYTGSKNLYHIDAYRCPTELNLDDLCLEDIVSEPFILAIEWPEKVQNLPQLPTFRLLFSIHGSIHRIQLVS